MISGSEAWEGIVDQDSLATDAYSNQVDEWVQRALDEDCQTFSELVYRLPGVFPTLAIDSLHRLSARGAMTSPKVMEMNSQARQDARVTVASLATDGLPVPHPLDFDWRFTDESVTTILAEAHLLSRHRGTLGIVGAPSVALRAGLASGARSVIVYDINQSVLAALQRSGARIFAQCCDVLYEEPKPAQLDVIVTDPPWYHDEICAALCFCQTLCRVGGYVLVSLPPVGTRPGLQSEREQLFATVAPLGLILERIEASRLPYRSPPFERNALRATGIIGAPVDWRRGDLAVFKKVKPTTRSCPRSTKPSCLEWSEVTIDAARMRMRQRREVGFSDPRLIYLVSGDVLPTVSRRDPRRSAASVWTVGNRVFGCQGNAILQVVTDALGSKKNPQTKVECLIGRRLTAIESRMTDEAYEQVAEVLRIEVDELRTYSGDNRGIRTRVFAS